MFTIGPFARLGGVSPKVLRSYDALGLFRPAWLDRSTGYRYYSPAQLPDLRRISALRDVGLGLTDIGRLVTGGADLRAALDRRRVELRAERQEIDRRLAALDIHLRAERRGGGPGEIVVRSIPHEIVAVRRVASHEDDEAAFDELEAHVRDQGRRARRPPGALVPPGAGWEIYVPLSGSIVGTDRIRQDRLPACRAATVIRRGPYDQIAAARAELDRWIVDAGLRAEGPLRIVYLQFGAEPRLRLPAGYVVESAAQYVTELQQPVATATPPTSE